MPFAALHTWPPLRGPALWGGVIRTLFSASFPTERVANVGGALKAGTTCNAVPLSSVMWSPSFQRDRIQLL